MSFKPYELITDTYWKKDFVITGQEIDYKNASQTITLLEKKVILWNLNHLVFPAKGKGAQIIEQEPQNNKSSYGSIKGPFSFYKCQTKMTPW